MKRRTILAMCLTAMLLLAACGGGGNAGAGDQTAGSAGGSAWGTLDSNTAESGATLPTAREPQESGEAESSVYQNAGAKLIRRAELVIQTTDFDQAVQSLNQMVSDCGGYFEQAMVYGGSYRNANAQRQGEYVVRIPAERYSQFQSTAGVLGYVTSSSESSEDVGQQYYDTETRLRTQRTKQERLLSLLEQAENMEDIISLESALSDVEYEIEQLSSTLNRYDALIDYATFNIYLDEVARVTEEVGETASLGQRMAAGVSASFDGLVAGAQELLVWISYNLFALVILAFVAAVAAMAGRLVYRKRYGRPKKPGKGAASQPPAEKDTKD